MSLTTIICMIGGGEADSEYSQFQHLSFILSYLNKTRIHTHTHTHTHTQKTFFGECIYLNQLVAVTTSHSMLLRYVTYYKSSCSYYRILFQLVNHDDTSTGSSIYSLLGITYSSDIFFYSCNK